MEKTTRRIATMIGLTLGLCGLMAAVPAFRQQAWDFESGEPGLIAAGFSNESGKWEVLLDGDNWVLAQRAESRFNVVNVSLAVQTSYKDVDLSVRIKAVGGENEQGGGVIFRAKDKDNYYVARYNPYRSRYNPREPNFRLYKFEEGKRTQLDHAVVPGDREWHTIRITAIGTEITGYLDGQKLLEAEETTFVDVGKIGLWSQSDARSYFDDLTVCTLPRPEKAE